MKIDTIKVQVTIIGEGFNHTIEEDYTEYAQDLIECENVFHNTKTPMTTKNIYDYFKDGTFTDEDIQDLNGNHFLYGFLETLGQSFNCPPQLHAYQGNLTYVTKRISTDKYKCVDCEKDLGDLQLNDEIKQKCPRSLDGIYYIICKKCSTNKE